MSDITFESLGLSQAMLRALEKNGYGWPTTIQAQAIPEFMQWKDVIAKAPTGTGKTFAFGIPMIEHIDPGDEAVQGLILAPTRELAIQIGDELRSLLTYFDLGGFAVHYNVLDADVLTDAKKHPEKYPNLQVRLCGWNVLFSTLSDKEKDEFIRRSMHC